MGYIIKSMIEIYNVNVYLNKRKKIKELWIGIGVGLGLGVIKGSFFELVSMMIFNILIYK